MAGVTFTGRPPPLCRRYTTTPLPLDISDDVLFSGELAMVKALDDILPNGWNRNGTLYPSTFIRARAQISFLREEIFEIAIGHDNSAHIATLLCATS